MGEKVDPYREACEIGRWLAGKLELPQPFLATGFDDAPDAVDFHINPETREPVVLERHGIYNFAPESRICRERSPSGSSTQISGTEPSGTPFCRRASRSRLDGSNTEDRFQCLFERNEPAT